MRHHAGRRVLGIGLTAVLALSVSGAPTSVSAIDDDVADSLRELQAELDALFAPSPIADDGDADVPDPTNSRLAPQQLAMPFLAAGPAGSPVIVTDLTLVENDATVTLEWTDVQDIGGFEVLRDGVVIAESDGTAPFVDTVAGDNAYEYEVRATDPGLGDTSVGVTTVVVPPAARGCDYSWTGAVDGAFGDPANWAPLVGAPEVPKDGDHICIDSRQNTPATSIADDAGVGSASTTLKADEALPALLEIAGGDFTVTTSFDGVDLLVSGGSFAPPASTTFRLLTVTDGELALTANPTAPEGVQFGPGAPTVTSATGSAVVFDVSPRGAVIVTGATVVDAVLTLDGPVQLGTFGDRVDLTGASSIVPGADAPTVGASSLNALSGVAQVDVSMSSSMIVEEGAALTVSDHQAFANETFPPQIAIGGALTLTQEITQLGNVDLRSSTSQLLVNRNGANDLSGLASINDMTIDEAVDIVMGNDLQIRSLSMNNGATFTVAGELDYTSFLSLSNATITAPTIVTSGPNSFDGDIDVFGTSNRILGDVTTGGTIRLNSDPEVSADAKLAIDGDLTLGAQSFIDTSLTGSDVTGRLAIRDTAALDGALLVRVNGVVPADTDIAAITWGSATGTIDRGITGNVSDTTIEQRAGGVFVRRVGGGLDITRVVALGLFVDAELGTELQLGWPAVLDTDRYRIVRDGDEIGETTETNSALDLSDAEAGDEVVLQVIAVGIEEDEIDLGTLTIVLPKSECSIAWTGAIDDQWSNSLNWLPVSDAAMPSPRVPGASDDVCVDIATNSPIVIDGDVSIDTITSGLADGPDSLIEVVSGDVVAPGGIDVPSVTVLGGSVTTESLVAESLAIGDAVVDATTSDLGALSVRAVGEGAPDAELLGVASIGLVSTPADTALRIEELQSPANTVLDLTGATTIDTGITALSELYLFEDATLSIGGAPVSVLTGLTDVGIVGLQGTAVGFPDGVTIGNLLVADSELQVGRDLTITGRWDLQDGSTVDIDGDLILGSAASVVVTSTTDVELTQVFIAGAASLDGALTVDIAETIAALPFVEWSSSTGTFDTTSLTGAGAAGTELVVDGDGISVEPVFAGPSALSVLGFDVSGALGPVDLLLAWPEFAGAAAYEVRRGNEVVATTEFLQADVFSEAKETETWSVIALDDGGREIGLVGSLDVLAAVDGCDVVWTGAVSDSWHGPLNWAPVIDTGGLPVQTVPGGSDVVCVVVDENLPVQVTSAVQIGGIVAGLPGPGGDIVPDVHVLAVTGAEFSSATGGTTSRVTVTDGVLDADGQFVVEGTLGLDTSTVELAGDLIVRGDIVVTDGDSVFDADPEAPIDVQAELLGITAANLLVDDDVRIDVERIELDTAIIGGGAAVEAAELVATAGVSGIAGVNTSITDVTVEAPARLVADGIGDLDQTFFELLGRLDLVAPSGKEIGGLSLEGVDALVAIDGGDTNRLTGITFIEELSVGGTTLLVEGDLATRRTAVVASALSIDGTLEVTDLLASGDAFIGADTVTLVEDPLGLIDPELSAFTEQSDVQFSITGDLVLRPDSTVRLGFDEIPILPVLGVNGTVALDGAISIVVDSPVPAGTDAPIADWDSSTGSATVQAVGSNAADVRIVETPTGLVLRTIVPKPDRLIAYGIELGDRDGDPSLVSLAWPAVDGATRYEIARDGLVFETSDEPNVTFEDPGTTPALYEVLALDADDDALEDLGGVTVFGSFLGCDLAWTGAASSDWNDPNNWVPVVFSGDPLPPMRSPNSSDQVCVAVDVNLPIQIDSDTTVASLTTIVDEIVPAGLPVATEVVAVDGAELSLTELARFASVTVTDGSIGTAALVIHGNLTLDNATVAFDTSELEIGGTVTSRGPGDRLVATSGAGSQLTIVEVVVSDADLAFEGDVTTTIASVQLDDAFLQGGKSTEITQLTSTGGVSTVDMDSLLIVDADVEEASTLALSTTRLDDTGFDVAGRLALPDGVTSLGRLDLAGSGVVVVGTGRDNDLTRVTAIDDLTVRDNGVIVENDVDVRLITLVDGSLAVRGELGTDNVLAQGTSEITADTLTFTSTVDRAAVLAVGNTPRATTLTIDGDLVLPINSAVVINLDALPTRPLIEITGAATLAGDAGVTIDELPVDDAEIDLIRWASATGTLVPKLFPEDLDPDQVSLLQRAAGLFLVGGEVDECGDAPRFAEMGVDGCWVDNGDDTYTASPADNPDGVAIGGVDVDFPADDVTITIDQDQREISSRDGAGEPVAVPVSVPVTRDENEVARISLGSITFDGFQIGNGISFSLGDLFGLPTSGTPTLTSGEGGWRLQFGLSLPGLLRTAGAWDLSIGEGGILSTDLSFDDLAAVFGDLVGILDLDIDWLDASTWSFDSGDLGGPSITGDVDFSEIDGGGTLSVRDLRVEDVAVLPDFDLTGVFTDTTKTWTVSQPPASVLREFGFQYTNDGDLVAASILLGDAAGESVRNSVATWGEWLDVDALELVWNDAAKQWNVAGRLASPQVDITGLYVGDGDGGTERFEISIDGTELGPLASVDLDLVYIDDGGGERFAVSANIARDGAPDIDGTGVFTFEDGDLATAQIIFDEIVIGELLTIEDFRVTWNDRQGRFAVDGLLSTPDGATNEVSGSLTFEDGRLLEGDLQLDSLTIGPIRFDQFALEFARTPADADQRITTASISGEVRAGSRAPTPVTGSIEFVDGEINDFELTVGVVDLGGLAQIEELTLSYTTNDAAGTATMTGEGRLVTSDGATDTPVLVELTLRDGRVVDGRIEADVLRFGRLLTIENLELINSPVTPGTCTDLPAPDGAQQWQVSGETTSNGQTTSIDGCLVIDGRRLVAGELELGNLRLGSLLTVQNLEASFAQQREVDVTTDEGETIKINQTDMSLSATVVVGDNDPASFSGSASFANGGLTAFELSLPDLDLMNVVRLRGVEFAYAGDTPWDDRDETSYRLRGSVVGENTTSSFDGEVVFGTDGEVTSLSIDAEEVDFGLFRIDVLSFAYGRDGDESEWAISGSVEVDGETTTISGSAQFEDGRIVEASLDIENLVIADLVVIDTVTLDYLRDSDGSEAWTGSGSFTSGGKSNEVSLGFAFDGDGRLVFGNVEIARIKWSELLVFDDVSFTYEEDGDKRRWDVTGSIDLEGEATGLAGFLELEAGRATAGELTITNLRIGELTTIRTLTLAADTTGAVTTWAASIAFDNDANTTGSGSLTWTDGRLTTAALDLTDIRFGPTFTLSEASLSLDQDEWSLSATLENAGDENSISFVLGFDDGRLVSAQFQIAQMKFGDVLTIDDFTISYAKTANGASWSGSSTVMVGDRTTSVAASFDFVEGRLITAEITIGQLRWSEAIVMDDVTLTFDRSTNLTRWTLDGGIIIDGETTSLSGFLELDDGRIIGGNLYIANLGVGPLATIEEFDLNYVAGDDGARFTAAIIFTNGASAAGSMTWVDGRLNRASIGLADIDLGPTFTLNDAVMSYTPGTWSFQATFNNDGSGATISGSLIFRDGRLVDGTLSGSDIRIAGFSLSDFALVLGDRVNVGGGNEAIADICDVPDPGGPGEVYGISAGFVNDDGSIGTIAGRLRSDDGRITEGVLCASDLSIAGILVIEDFLLQPTTIVAGDQVQETWSGSIALRNPGSPDEPFTGDFDWVSRNGATESVEIVVGELRFSDLLAFETVSFSYDKTPGGSTWAIGATLKRPGSNPSVSGSIDFTDGSFSGAELTISDVSFGNAFSLREFTMTYVGRRAESTLPDQNFDDDGVFPPLPVGNCNATPSGSNVPSGPPSTTGTEAYFRIGATVGVGDSAFGAAGSIGMVDGRMSVFDVSISCMNFGEWLTLEDIRIGRSADGDYLFQAGELGSSGPALRAAGRINMGDDGRVTGGRLNIRGLSLGMLELDSLRLVLGEQDDGTSEWGAGVAVTDPQGDSVFIGGGSVQIDDGRVIGGTLELPDLPLLDFLPVRDVSLGLERLGNGALRLSGGVTIVGPNDADLGDVDLRAVWNDGDLVSGSIQVSATELFGVIETAAFELTYDADAEGGPRWSGSLQAQGSGSSSSAIAASIDVVNGRVDSGIIGFDGNGDGVVDPLGPDGTPPVSGNGALGGFPLKGLYLRYCAADTTATFCSGVVGSEWKGNLVIELPTSGAPALDASFTVRDGRFVRAAINLDLDPGIMIFAGVFLDSIGGALELDPRLRLCGELGATVGSPSIPLGRIEGSFQFSEEYNDLGFFLLRPDPPVGCGEAPTPGPFPLPADLEPDFYRFLLQTEMDLFPNNGLGIDLSGTGYLDFWTTGYLELGATVNADFWGNSFNVSGSVVGSIVDADNVTALRESNGQQLSGTLSQLSGEVSGSIRGRTIASAELLLNSIGWSGCARLGSGRFSLRLGASGYWWGGATLGCNMGRVAIFVPGSTNPGFDTLVSDGFLSMSALTGVTPAADTVFEVGPGEPTLGIMMRSTAGTPNTQVISPSGVVYVVSGDFGEDGPLTITEGNDQGFLIADPEPGTWTVRQVAGSPLLSSVEISLALPDLDVSADLTQAGSELSFDYSVLEVPGQSVSFVERNADGVVINMLELVETPRTEAAASASLRAGADSADSIVGLDALSSVGTATGSVSYRSNAAFAGGEHELVAIVEQDGLPRSEVVLATYDIATAAVAGVPTAVTATATSGGATVTWEPPVDDGGRRITAYHVFSERGFTLSVDGDVRSAELQIPQMSPGESLEVYVRAFTAAGPGDAATADFVATSSSGPIYRQPVQPESFVVGSTPIDRPDVTPVFGPGAVPTPVDPPAQTPQPAPQPPVVQNPSPNLPTTGSDSNAPVNIAILLLLTGLALWIGSRRRLNRSSAG